MDLLIYAESYDQPTRISITNECQTVEELAQIVARKLGLLLVACGPGDHGQLPYELRRFESGAVLANKQRIRDVLHDRDSLVIRK